MTKLIYIASSPHSGSTLLEMLLSAHPAIYGLGETQMLINDYTRHKYMATAHSRICSCGMPIDKCILWSKFIRFVQNEASGDFSKRYMYLLNLAYKEFGKDSIVTDSSKYMASLQQIVDAVNAGKFAELGITSDDLLVLHLIKDVRSYVASMKTRGKLSSLQFASLINHYYTWCRDNNKMEQYLESEGIQFLKISYEALCFNKKSVLHHICNKASIAFDGKMESLANSNGHIGLGNPMRTHKIKSKNIIYDYRWFYQMSVHLTYLLLPGIRRCNERMVAEGLLYKHTSNLFEPKETFDE